MFAVVAGIAGSSRPAEACSPPEELAFYPQLGEALAGVPTDGVIAFRASANGELAEAMALLAIAVTQDGVAVEGAIETVVLETREDWVITHDLFVVWRPAAPFAASSEYVATITVDSPYNGEVVEEHALAVTTGAGPAGALPSAAIGGESLGVQALPGGPRICCNDGNDGDCGFGECLAPEVFDQATLSANVSTGDDPLLTQSFVRVRAGTEGSTAPYAVLGRGDEIDDVSLQYSFPQAGTSYCLGVEVVSLIDGSVGAPVEVCVDHGELVLGSAENPGLDGWLEGCIDPPYWEDTHEPYEPGTGESGGEGGSEGGEGEGEGGSEGEGEGGSEGGEGSGSGSGGQDGDLDRGCACDAGEGSPLGAGLLAVVVGATLRRRRR